MPRDNFCSLSQSGEAYDRIFGKKSETCGNCGKARKELNSISALICEDWNNFSIWMHICNMRSKLRLPESEPYTSECWKKKGAA